MKVITGSTKKLLLETLDGLDTGPTTDRIEEALFNMLQPDLPGCMFLDPFSGNGTIGIEALSRGTGLAVMIEDNPRALECIRESLARVKLEGRAMVMGCDVITGLKRLEGKNYRFDTVFMDPPYHHEYERLALDYLSRSPMVTEDTLTVAEASRETGFGWLEESGWYTIKNREYKTNKYVFVGKGKWTRITVYPGGSDPIILGHYDIIKCTAKMMGKLIVGVFNSKTRCPLFSAQERANMLREVTVSLSNVEVQSFEGLLIDFVRGSHADVVVKGLQAITDFGYELQMAQISKAITPKIDTVFLATSLEYSYLSPNTVKEIAEYEGNINEFLHPVIAARVREKLEERRRLI